MSLPQIMPSCWLSVLTTPRRPQYLAATLAALDEAGARVLRIAGFLRSVVCVDAPSIPPGLKVPDGWELIAVGQAHGPGSSRRAMHAIARLASAADAPRLLYLEDDVLPCRYAIVGAFDLPIPRDCGFLTLCDVRTLAGPATTPPRIVTMAADDPKLSPGFWGSQALLIPGAALAELARAKIAPNDWPWASDVWIGQRLASTSAPWSRFGILAPSLFQHVGEKSAVDPTWTLEPHRVASTFRPDTDGVAVCRYLGARDPF